MNIHIIIINQSLLSHHDWIPGHGEGRDDRRSRPDV